MEELLHVIMDEENEKAIESFLEAIRVLKRLNELITEESEMINKNLEDNFKRADRIAELEGQIVQLKVVANEIKGSLK